MPFMGVRRLASGKGRVLALAVSVTLSAAVIYVQSTEHPTHVQAQAAAPAPPTMAPPAAAPQPVPASQADLLAASAPVAAQDYQLALPRGITPEQGLQVKTIWVARAISTLYPQITTIGGYREDYVLDGRPANFRKGLKVDPADVLPDASASASRMAAR